MAGISWQAMEAVEIEQFLENSIIKTESIAPTLCMKTHAEVPAWGMEAMNQMDCAFMAGKRLRTVFISPPKTLAGSPGRMNSTLQSFIDCALSVA